jgi:hypothetical protein
LCCDAGFWFQFPNDKKRLPPIMAFCLIPIFFFTLYFFFSVYEFARKKLNLEICIWGLQSEPAIEFQRQQVNDISQEQILDSGM